MLRVLHLVGSCEDEFEYKNSLYYANSCQSFGKFDFIYAVISLDKKWRFTTDLKALEMTATSVNLKNEGETNGVMPAERKKMTLAEAINEITKVINPDVVLHHLFCQSGSVYYRCLMEMMEIPLVGSPSNVVSITKNKATTKAVLTNAGICMPNGIVVTPLLIKSNPSAYIANEVQQVISYPCVVKAACVEDSLGVYLVRTGEELSDALSKALALGDEVLIEEFIPGREVRCGVLEDHDGFLQVLPLVEYAVDGKGIRSFAYKLELDTNGKLAKSGKNQSHILPPGNDLEERVGSCSVEVFKILNLRDFGLFDFRIHEKTGRAYLLEVNLFCSFGSESALNILARQTGYTDQELLEMVLSRAASRK